MITLRLRCKVMETSLVAPRRLARLALFFQLRFDCILVATK